MYFMCSPFAFLSFGIAPDRQPRLEIFHKQADSAAELAAARPWLVIFVGPELERRGEVGGRNPVRHLACALILSVAGAAASALAQDAVTDTKTKGKTTISVEDGKDLTLTGCVARSESGDFMLKRAAGKDGALGEYMLVAAGDEWNDLGKHVGHRVEIKGTAADRGDGKMTIKTESETRTNNGDTRKRESTTKVEGDLNGLPFLGVKSVRMLATICP
jgi:hypothetical protein